MFSIKQTIERLQQKNEKAYYLAFLRVAVSLWFLKELLFRWPAFEILYSTRSFLNIDPDQSLSAYHINAVFLKEHYMLIVYTIIALLLLNIAGIGRNLTSLVLFIVYALLYNLNNRFTNGGDKISMLLLFYLSFANTYSHFTVFKRKPLPQPKEKLYNLLSNLAAYSIIINLCLAYFIAGLTKLMNHYWQNGSAVYYLLNYNRFSVFAEEDNYTSLPAILSYIFNYGALLLELSFPFLVLYKRTRTAALLLCLAMHLFIYCFFMIYGMSIIFVVQYGLFYKNEEVIAVSEKIKSFFKRRLSFALK